VEKESGGRSKDQKSFGTPFEKRDLHVVKITGTGRREKIGGKRVVPRTGAVRYIEGKITDFNATKQSRKHPKYKKIGMKRESHKKSYQPVGDSG